MSVQSGPLLIDAGLLSYVFVLDRFVFVLVGQQRSVIYQWTAPVYRSFNNRYSILLPMASLQEKLPNVLGESPNLKVLPLALLEVGSTWNKFFWLSPVNAMAPVHIFPGMSGQSWSITAAYVYKSYDADFGTFQTPP